MSPLLLCILVVLYFTGYALPYYIFSLYLTKLEGNKFVNSAIIGCVQAFSVSFSGMMMTRLADMCVLHILFTGCVFSYVFFIFFPDLSTVLIYVANCIFVGSMGGWQNLAFLIAELRVPPQSLGSVVMIGQTVGVGSSALVPFIA